MSNNAHELSNRLLNALDNNYNVVDMHTVNEIISVLERINITKELLETTRLGKHVNELRRKTTDPTLARRAKVLVKRWRDLVIPTVASPGHAGSNRSSAERQVRRLGGTPLTSPALSRQVVSPAVLSPRPPSRPAWGGYESDSQDVILVDDEPPLPPPPPPNPLANTHKPLTPPVKRPPSPEPLYDEKKAKRDKKPKKRRGHSRAGTGAETLAAPAPGVAPPAGPGAGAAGAGALPAPAPAAPWGTRNGASHERRRNGTRQPVDSYAALVHRMPPAGAKKVKTTKELLEQIQSRGSRPATSPGSPRSPRSPASPDVMLIEPDAPAPVKVESPLRNGAASPRAESPESTCAPLEDEREYCECTCGAEAAGACPAAARAPARPGALLALHHAYVPGVNGTRAPLHPHRFAVRPLRDPARPELFASVVPLYKYSDYADDYCAKNMARVPLCEHLPWTSFAPPPPEPPPPPSPPPPRPYPPDDGAEPDDEAAPSPSPASPAPSPAPSEVEPAGAVLAHSLSPPPHRTVERTKAPDDAALDGAALVAAARAAVDAVPYDYAQLAPAPVLSLAALSSDDAIVEALLAPAPTPDRPGRPERFAEWHECATLGRLVALPYVVID